MNDESFSILFLAASDPYKAQWLKDAMFWAYPLAIIGFFSLLIVIVKMIKMLGAAQVARVPLAAESSIEINDTGAFEICLEVPMMTFLAGSGLDYELIGEADGQRIALHATAATLFGKNNGVTMTFPVRVFEISRAGTYQLRVSGFKPEKDYSRYSAIVARPTILKTFLHVFGIVASALMLAGGITFISLAHQASR